jgi:hypothetical protein
MPSWRYWAIAWSTMPVVGSTITCFSPAARADVARASAPRASDRPETMRAM